MEVINLTKNSDAYNSAESTPNTQKPGWDISLQALLV